MDAVSKAFEGMTVEAYAAGIDEWLEPATHPTLARRYLACAYAPMIELLRYLEANGFTTYIASGPTMSAAQRVLADGDQPARRRGHPAERAGDGRAGLACALSSAAAERPAGGDVELPRLAHHIGVTELQPTADGRDVQIAGAGTAPEPGMLLLRIDGPLYTANVRTVNRRIVAAVDAADGKTVVLRDVSRRQALLSAAMQFADLDREIR